MRCVYCNKRISFLKILRKNYFKAIHYKNDIIEVLVFCGSDCADKYIIENDIQYCFPNHPLAFPSGLLFYCHKDEPEDKFQIWTSQIKRKFKRGVIKA